MQKVNAVLTEIQSKLIVGKNRYNNFGGFAYRSAEDIYKAVKPLLKEAGATLYMMDSIEQIGERFYVKATARFCYDDEFVEVSAYAREALSKKGMDDSQVTGACSSYARKYAIAGLFLLDAEKDADSDESGNSDVGLITEEQKEALTKLGVSDLEKIAKYYRKSSIDEVTFEEAEKAITMKGGRI